MKRKRNKAFSKADVEYVYQNYNDHTAKELSKKRRGLSEYQVNRIVAKLRKNGVHIPDKKKTSEVDKSIAAFLKDNPNVKKARKKPGPKKGARKKKQ